MSLKLGFEYKTNVLCLTTHKQEKLDTINLITLANRYGQLVRIVNKNQISLLFISPRALKYVQFFQAKQLSMNSLNLITIFHAQFSLWIILQLLVEMF